LTSAYNLYFWDLADDFSGTIDEVTSEVFPEQDQHPSYLTGVFNHGVYSTGPFSCVHAGIANAVIGPVDSHQARLTPSYLAQSIIECPDLSTTLLSAPEILHAQLRKLTVNATINPLTAIYNCTNGELFEHASIREFIDSMLAEISAVIIAHLGTLPQHFKPSSETTDMSYLASYEMFSPEALKEEVYKAGKQTYKNISSMNQDVRAGRKTEIGYITGWITKRSEDLGLNSPFNETVEMVVGFSEILNLKTQSNMLYEKMHQFKFPVSVCE
jgi:2-dehydropantoate 2-reductase